jgi:hypothetical protein
MATRLVVQSGEYDMAGAPDDITPEQIRERAHELWERNHRPEGFDLEFWLLAERELRAERAIEAARARGDAASPPGGGDASRGG